MSSIGKLMKQAARMQQQIELVQAALAQRTVKVTKGGGAVKVTATCDGSLTAIKIARRVFNQPRARSLENMILSAANHALNRAKKISDAEIGKVTAKLSLRGLT